MVSVSAVVIEGPVREKNRGGSGKMVPGGYSAGNEQVTCAGVFLVMQEGSC